MIVIKSVNSKGRPGLIVDAPGKMTGYLSIGLLALACCGPLRCFLRRQQRAIVAFSVSIPN